MVLGQYGPKMIGILYFQLWEEYFPLSGLQMHAEAGKSVLRVVGHPKVGRESTDCSGCSCPGLRVR